MTDQTNNPAAGHDSGVPLRDHTFDGIQEFDNKLPNWWLWTFWIACIFSIFYWMWAHGLGLAPTDREDLVAELERRAEAQEQVDVSREALLVAAADPEILAKGKQLFSENCFSCHGYEANSAPIAEGVQMLGPNLTDDYWLHGGHPEQIHNTILNGVPIKGMSPWGQLGPAGVRNVAAFVISVRGTNVEGGKEPQGEKFTPED